MNHRPGIATLIVVVLISMFGLGAGCACNHATSHDGDSHAAEQTLMRLDGEWSASTATRDVEKVVSFYTDDAIAYPPNQPVAVGKPAMKKVWAAYLNDPSFRLSWKSNDAHVSSDGKLGYTAGPYEASYNGPDGKPMTEKGKFLCIWQKQSDGSWKATRDMWNADAK